MNELSEGIKAYKKHIVGIASHPHLCELICTLANNFQEEDVLESVKFIIAFREYSRLPTEEFHRLAKEYWEEDPVPDSTPIRNTKTFTIPTNQIKLKNIYLMHNHRNNLYKIGISNDPVYRENTLQSEEPEVELVAHWPGTLEDERSIHGEFAHRRVRGEWFKLNHEEVSDILTRNHLKKDGSLY